jgi:aminoacyl tRNA synthase complex-interacting multifunctional protein 1
MSNKSALDLLNTLITELELSISSSVSSSAAANISTASKPEKIEKHVTKERKETKEPKATKENNKPVKAVVEAPKEDAPLNINAIDLRVGVIRKVEKHATAEKLYCEEIDVGEETPRAIASGLVPYYTLEQMQNRKLIVVCNLKPRNLVGFKSHGMVLCASKTNADGSHSVEFVDPPTNAQPGDRIVGEGLVEEPLTASKCDKMKAFELLATDLAVNDQGIACWKTHRLVVQSTGEICTAPTLTNAPIK